MASFDRSLAESGPERLKTRGTQLYVSYTNVQLQVFTFILHRRQGGVLSSINYQYTFPLFVLCGHTTRGARPWGHVESNESTNEGGFQKLGRLSRPSPHHLLTWCLWDLRGFYREVMSEVDRMLMSLDLMGLVVSWVGQNLTIQARYPMLLVTGALQVAMVRFRKRV